MANLNLKDDIKANVYSDTFTKNVNDKTLSDKEIEWGAKCIDDMVKSIYTEEELNKLKAAGIDPATGIMIDGKPINFYQIGIKYSDVFGSLDATQSGTIKCQIVANALEGKKLDVIKYGIDENGAVTAKEAVPVNTEVKVSAKSTNFFRRILEAIGLLSPKPDEKIIAANNEPRDYTEFFAESAPEREERDRFKNEMNDAKEKFANKQLDDIKVKTPQKSEMLSKAQRHAISMQCRAESVKHSDLKKKMDEEFFADLIPENRRPGLSLDNAIGINIQKFFNLSNAKNDRIRSIDASISRRNTRISVVLLYGMTQGHSLDELTAPENSELRKTIGKQFIKDMGTKTLEDFAKSNGLDKDAAETKNQYKAYFNEQRAKIEKFYIDGFEKLRLEPLDIPDPNNYTEFAQKYSRLQLLGSIVKDIEQTSSSLVRNTYDNSAEDAALHDRYSAFMKYIVNETGAFKTTNLDNYFGFLASPDFAESRDEKNVIGINLAAQGKAAAQYLYDKTRGMDYVANFIDNEELSANNTGLCFKTNSADKSLADAAYKSFLCTNDPDMKTVLYDENSKQFLQFGTNNEKGTVFDMSDAYQERMDKGVSTRTNLNKYIPAIGYLRESGSTLSEAYQYDIIEKPMREKAQAEKAQAEKAAKATENTNTKEMVDKPTEVDKAAREKEKFIENAMKDKISFKEAEQLWKDTERDKRFEKALDEMMKEADELQIIPQTETKTRITADELMGTTNQKMTMPSKETQAPTKQMGMSKP